jgi:hypothetical protein
MMQTPYFAHMRAHALARVARIQPDSAVALELESLAINILQVTHNFEIEFRRLFPSSPAFQQIE